MIYETTNRTSVVIDTCRLLFVTGRDKLTYYNKLKTLIPKEQWKSFLDAMMKETEFSNYFSFGGSAEADIYVKEQDNERLFTLLSSTIDAVCSLFEGYSFGTADCYVYFFVE